MRRTTPPILSALLCLLGAALSAQAPKPAADNLKALAELQDKLKANIEQNRIDPGRDSLSVIQNKRAAISKALKEFDIATKRLLIRYEDLGRDHARMIEATTPRLRGVVVTVGPGQEYERLNDACRELEGGEVLLLAAGRHEIHSRGLKLRDVVLVGQGRDQTTLQCNLRRAQRVKLTNLTIDCKNSPCVDLRDGDSIQLEKCLVKNYNSGAGGSNGVFSSNSTVYLQDCEFEGDSGRLAGRNRFGDAMDLRNETFLLARGTLFRDNSEIVRVTGFCIFDHCRSVNSARTQGISTFPEGFLLTRDLVCKVRGNAPREFTFASDDAEVVKFLAGRRSPIDKTTREAMARLQLARSPRYWATLLQHADNEVRFIAQGQLRSLLRGALPKFVLDRKKIASLPKEMQRPLTDALRTAHALRWLDDNESELLWKPGLKCYQLRK